MLLCSQLKPRPCNQSGVLLDIQEATEKAGSAVTEERSGHGVGVVELLGLTWLRKTYIWRETEIACLKCPANTKYSSSMATRPPAARAPGQAAIVSILVLPSLKGGSDEAQMMLDPHQQKSAILTHLTQKTTSRMEAKAFHQLLQAISAHTDDPV